MSHSWRALAVLALIALSASAGHGQDGDPFAEPPPPAPPARQEQAPPPAAPAPARPALRVRGVSVVAGRAPAALLDTGGGGTLVARAGDLFAASVGAELVECRVHDVAPGAVRVGLVGTELSWVVR